MQNNQCFLPIELLSVQAIEYIEKIKELIDAVKDDFVINDLSPNLTFIREKGPVTDTALIEKGDDDLYHIRISENYCQYLWSVGLYLSVYFDNMIQIPMMDMAGTNNHNHKANKEDMEFAHEMFFRGRRLLDHFVQNLYWENPNIASPTPFNTVIGYANGIYCASIAFIYAHEFSHNFLGHTHFENNNEHSVQDETAADLTAIGFIKEEYNTSFGFTYKVGVATVLSSLLLMDEKSISGGGSHPDMDVRIENLMNELSLSEMDNLWGYMSVAIRMWLLVYKGITPLEEIEMTQSGFATYKDMYDFYLSKLKEARQRKFPKDLPPEWSK